MIIIQIILFFTLTAIVHYFKRAVVYCCWQANLWLVHPELKDSPSCNIFLELSDLKDRALVYVMTVRAPVQHLSFQGTIRGEHLKVDEHKLYSVIRPAWKVGDCILHVDDLILELPCLLQVPVTKRKLIHRLISEDCRITMLATDGTYMYRLSQSVQLLTDKNSYQKLIQELQARAAI